MFIDPPPCDGPGYFPTSIDYSSQDVFAHSTSFDFGLCSPAEGVNLYWITSSDSHEICQSFPYLLSRVTISLTESDTNKEGISYCFLCCSTCVCLFVTLSAFFFLNNVHKEVKQPLRPLKVYEK